MANPLRSASQSRRLLGPLLKSWYRISVDGAERVPQDGPLLVVSNHPGVLDAGVVLACLPRPVRVLDSDGVLAPVLDRALNLTGRIRMAPSGPDVAAVHEAVEALRSGHAVAVFPEKLRADGTVSRVRHEMAFLALRTDAVILPVAIFGTATPGMAADALPKRGTGIHLHVGMPYRLGRVDDAYRRSQVAATAEGMRQRLTDHVAAVQAELDLPLPGDPTRQLARSRREAEVEAPRQPGDAGSGTGAGRHSAPKRAQSATAGPDQPGETVQTTVMRDSDEGQ